MVVGSQEQAVAYRARWVVPVEGPPIDGGVVTISSGRIVAVGRNDSGRPPRDLGDVALAPGLVNAHTHLEFGLSHQLGEPQMPFAKWLADVVGCRAQQKQQSSSDEEWNCSRAMQVALGWVEMYDSGTAVVGEIARPDFAIEEYDAIEQVMELSLFGELIGLAADRIEPLLQQAREYIHQATASPHQRLGLSPHAPYTIHPRLLSELCRLSAAEAVPLAMHLAESREELELLDSQTGPLVEFLESLGAWQPAAIPWGARPLEYLQELAKASRTLIIHGNYLAADEIEMVAATRDRMSVVYCPRTHAYFGHEAYPLDEMLAAGARVAVGTDSCASNPDLNLFEELRHIALHHPTVSPADVLRMGTIAGAEALGLADTFGSIAVGKSGRLAVAPLRTATSSPYEALFTSAIGSCRPLAQFGA